MASTPEIWILVFQQLVDDHVTLCNVGLVSRTWRSLSWPSLLTIVDLSSHNIERRLTEHESTPVLPIVYSHHHAKYRPRNLVPRQRLFLRLITAQPALANNVKVFTWTLIWRDSWSDSDHSPLLDIDRETWIVFARLFNVTHLDLASINDCDDDIVSKNPTHLFPKVTDLRLLGWMHRGLVRAILTTIDTARLRSFTMDYLEDQGSMPGGYPMNMDIAWDFAKTSRQYNNGDEVQWIGTEHLIDDSLFQRQEMDKAAAFPGPMWYPMRLLSGCALVSLSYLQMTIPHFDKDLDIRNYYTTFREAATLLRKSASSLKSLVVIFGESALFHPAHGYRCPGNHNRFIGSYRIGCIRLTAAFLKQLLIVLSECLFPNLTQVTFEGFTLLKSKEARPSLEAILPYIQNSRFNDVDFIGTPHLDARQLFPGHDSHVPRYDEEVLRNS